MASKASRWERLSRSRTLDAEVLLSDENYHHQRCVAITHAMPYSRRFPLILGPYPEIRRTYAKGVLEMKFLQVLGDYGVEKSKLDSVRSRLCGALRPHYQERDRLRLLILYRKGSTRALACGFQRPR